MRRTLPTVDVINEWFVEQTPGVLYWRKDYITSRNGAMIVARAGEVAGITLRGRVQINLQGRTYFRSRLIYKLHTGQQPKVLQYINGDTLDDRFENLKNVSANPNVRYTRDRDQDYFVVTARTSADGRRVKTVALSWRCEPDENAEEIAAELNRRCEDYLRGLRREKLAREAEEELMDVPEAQRRSASEAIRKLREQSGKPTLEMIEGETG
jgi:hypothetical protein